MKRLLSTKLLKAAHSKRLKTAGWDLTQYNAISVERLPVSTAPGERLAIFSSKHAVQACLSGPVDLSGVPCLCVGEKSKALLAKHGIEVLEVADTASALAVKIAQKYTDKTFIYYCGNRRLDILPNALNQLGQDWEEEMVYRTSIKPRQFQTSFQGILFFSPSGVESFVVKNDLRDTWAYCIGETTAGEAKKYTDRVLIGAQPTLEALVNLAVSEHNPVNS
mgnify:CR=1 FL=1